MKNILLTGGAGFIGSNLALELQNRFPYVHVTVIDDFRSGHFKNLIGFRGDVLAMDVSRIDWKAIFGEVHWDAVFHLASITDTTEHDQRLQVHDNAEGFRKLMEYLKPMQTPIVFASSAATYGIASGVNREEHDLAPANVYAFSKMIMENMARRYMRTCPGWKIVGVRYFNVYGPREAHKGVPASMIYHLAQQMKAGKKPRLFKHGEQMRDFVYVKDVVSMTIAGLNAESSTVVNVGTGVPRAFNDIVAILNPLMGLSAEIEYMDNPYSFYQTHTEAATDWSRKQLGVTAQYSLEEGIKDYFESGWLLP